MVLDFSVCDTAMPSIGPNRGQWTKIKAIGQGAFGVVYLVQSQQSGDCRKFVMKEVSLRGLPREEMAAAQNEVAALKKLRHPHVIAIVESFVNDETLCIVMEWAEGADLSTLIARRMKEGRPFSEEEVLLIFWQLTSALAHCHHDLRMLHRDLKPQNVFLAANGDVKLGDFGLAKVVEATRAAAHTLCGTPLYMSPELCLGQGYNRGADVYALGCILYELMSLRPPWSDLNLNGPGGMTAFLKRIAQATLDIEPLKRRYSLELCNLLGSLVHKQARCRPALDKVLQLDLVCRAAPVKLATPRGTAAQQPPRPQPSPRSSPTANIRGGGGGGENRTSRALPPSWKQVPSASRPGEWSYLHLQTGYKQAHFPESDQLPPEVLQAFQRQQATAGGNGRPPPTAIYGGGGRPSPARSPVPSVQGGGGAPGGTPRSGVGGLSPTPRLAGNPGHTGPVPRSADRGGGGSGSSWRKVPSSSRPGEFSYLHMPTGYKQVEVPTTDAPPPAAFAQWRATKGGRPPSAQQPLTPHGQVNGQY